MGRRLGQHFLSDPRILDRIADSLSPQATDVVIEIGPGRGSLTRRLAPRVARVIAIEKDRRLAKQLREAGSGKRAANMPLPANVSVVAGDALAFDWFALAADPTLPASRFPLPGFKIIGNIPYAITSPLIEKALTPPLAHLIVFLVQREVADRLAAAPGTKAYGALTVGVQLVATVERLFPVRAGSFTPPPRVASAVVRLRPRDEPRVAPDELAAVRRFVTALFSQRRKQLRGVLRGLVGLDPSAADAALHQVGAAPADRAEVLSPSQLVALHRAVSR